jgi:DNA anti-recombination protein RmuC
MPTAPNHAPAGDDSFRKIEAILDELRAAANAPPEPPESWAKRTFSASTGSSRQRDFNIPLVEALTETLNLLRATAVNHEAHLDRVAQEASEMRALSDNLDAFRERSDRFAAELRSAATSVKGLQERAASIESELARAREELSIQNQKLADEMREGFQKLANEMREGAQSSGNEMRERIQHLLDEQRVCIRQLSLQASEQAILADRARRAVELKVEELARRAGNLPA